MYALITQIRRTCMKKRALFLLTVLAILVTSSGLFAGQKLTLMLDWFPNIDHLPIYVAQQRNFFTENDLEVKVISPSDTSDALKLAASGKVDIAISYEPQTVIAAAEGINIIAFGRLIEHPLTTLLFLKSRGIEKPTDLEGKTIGYTVPGLMDVMMEAFAKINGIRKYTPVNVGFTIIPALVAQKVDAVMGPFKTYETVIMAQKGYQAAFFELEKFGIPDYDELIFICSENTLKKKERALRTFSQIMDRAIKSIRANPDKALESYFAALPEADRKLETDAFRLTKPYYARNQKLDVHRWQIFCDFAHQYGLVKNQVDAKILLKIWE